MATFVGHKQGSGTQGNAGKRTSSLAAPSAFNQNSLRGYRAVRINEGTRISHLPIEISHLTRVGREFGHLLDMVYNRFHTSVKSIDFGSIVTRQQAQVIVWNAFFAPRTLTDIGIDLDSGLTVEGALPPHSFGPLEDQTYAIYAGPEGTPELDALVTWNFGATQLAVRVTGSRVLFWGFLPNWQSGVTERLEWLTDILSSPLGIEQRRALRLGPRRTYEVQLIAIPSERAILDLMSLEWGTRRWAIPVWPDIQLTNFEASAGDTFLPCRTEGMEFREGGLLAFRGTSAMSYEIGVIEKVSLVGITLARPLQQDWPYGSRLYPAVTAQFLDQPETRRLTNTIGNMRATFMLSEPAVFAALAPPMIYRDKPVFLERPEETEDLTYTYQRLLDIVDNQTGLRRVHDTAGVGFTAQAHMWQMANREDRLRMRGLWYYLRGMQRSVWVPTHNDDLILASDVEANSNAINCNWLGYSRYAAGKPARRDILITLRDGTHLARRIQAATEEGATERLVLDQPLDVSKVTRPSDIERISFLALSRLDQDFIEIKHDVDSDGLATSRAVWRSLRDDAGAV